MVKRAFTLVELVVVIAILGILAALLTPALATAFRIAERTTCASNLRQIGLATQLYLKDNDGWFFPLVTDTLRGRRWYFGLEPSASPGCEGERVLDRTEAALYPYLHAPESVEACPSVPFGSPYKPKFKGASWSYGINWYLCNHHGSANFSSIRPQDAGRTLLYADAAQINTWLAPASPSNPMVEDHYWIRPGTPQVQFRHGGLANVLFADWHVEACPPKEGSYDRRLPSARIGCLDGDEVLFRPRQGR